MKFCYVVVKMVFDSEGELVYKTVDTVFTDFNEAKHYVSNAQFYADFNEIPDEYYIITRELRG